MSVNIIVEAERCFMTIDLWFIFQERAIMNLVRVSETFFQSTCSIVSLEMPLLASTNVLIQNASWVKYVLTD